MLFLAALHITLSFGRTAADTFAGANESVFTVEIQAVNDRSLHAQGSAFVVLGENLLITNYHVISDSILEPDLFMVVVIDANGKHRDAKVRAVDVINDLAILSTEESIGRPLTIRQSIPSKGTKAFSLGNPGGLGLMVVEGIYNGLSESSYVPTIHFSGAINAGMSGGPTVDENGQVIGVNTASRRRDQLIGLLAPADRVTNLLNTFSTSLSQAPHSLKAQIEKQIVRHSDEMTRDLLIFPIEKVVSGGFTLPAIFHDQASCYGDLEKELGRRFLVAVRSCSLRGGIFVSQDLQLGTITVSHRRIYGDHLSASQVAYAQNQLSRSDVEDSGSPVKGKTEWLCRFATVILQSGLKGVLHACRRQLSDFAFANDHYYLFASRPKGNEGLLTEIKLKGITDVNAKKIINHFFNSISSDSPKESS